MESIYDREFMNKYVIVRSDKAGILFGILVAKNGSELVLRNMRKIWYFSGANSAEDIAMYGLKNPENSKVTTTIDICVVGEFVQILPCTDTAITNLKNIKTWSY